ncbi:MAG: hypothetical protein CM1200mP29_04630 [Verrucomicrobiota bacterium]|nr:MAG: hypothetical protein CM1200mP29_04630 [Verrucomicrobiota bacterium]
MKKNYITMTVGAFLVIIFGFMLFTFQVRQTEVAIKTRFGRPVRLPSAPVFTFACLGR